MLLGRVLTISVFWQSRPTQDISNLNWITGEIDSMTEAESYYATKPVAA